MMREWKNTLDAVLLCGGLAMVAGCGDDAQPAPSEDDPDMGDAASADAGCPAADAGCPAADAGCPAADAGCPAAESALPEDPSAWQAWLDAKSYESWRCDPEPQPKIGDSPHGDNIICVNDTLWSARSGSGPYPQGSAAVKLTFDAEGEVSGRYIDARVEATPGADAWYFYVAGGPEGRGDESAVAFCASCHDNDGARDYVRRIPSL